MYADNFATVSMFLYLLYVEPQAHFVDLIVGNIFGIGWNGRVVLVIHPSMWQVTYMQASLTS